MKSYIKSIIFLSCILVGGNYVCGMEGNNKPEPAPGRTIIATVNITVFDVNQDVKIINDRDGDTTNTRADIDRIEIYKLGEGDNVMLRRIETIYDYGQGVISNKKYTFSQSGKYMIYYFFRQGFTITDMSFMFGGCSALTTLDFSNFNANSVTNMSFMFYRCSALTSLNLSNFNTKNVTNMYYMFFECCSLTSLDLSNFNTESVTNMSFMFNGCSSLTSLDLSDFDTQNVTNMSYMFYNCSSLTKLDVSSFNTNRVIRMCKMFYKCSSLTVLCLSNFYTPEVVDMSKMFAKCSSLTKLDLSNFSTNSVTNMSGMFAECKNLRYLNISLHNELLPSCYVCDVFRNCNNLDEFSLLQIPKKFLPLRMRWSCCRNLV